MGKESFKKLLVWQRAKEIAVQIYRLTKESALAHDYALTDQIRRSAVSVASNIAEGQERDSDKDGNRFLWMAKGSIGELRTQLQIAVETGQIPEKAYESIDANCETLAKMIGRLIQSRSTVPRLVPRASRPVWAVKKAT
jgi:four helix bundle protein